MISSKKSLIITLPPRLLGGVRTKAKILANYLFENGSETTIAYYSSFSSRSGLNVSFLQRPFQFTPKINKELPSFGKHSSYAVGCYFPEYEGSLSTPSKLWEQLIRKHDYHFVVGGSPVMGNILEKFNLPYIVWCGSDVEGDRGDRQRMMPFMRREFDRKLVMPMLLRQQKRVVNGNGRILAVSKFTQGSLEKINKNPKKVIGLLSIPTDISFFVPSRKLKKVARLGFAGRLNDPRKNSNLLFSVLAQVKKEGLNPELRLTGDSSPKLDDEIRSFSLSENVSFSGVLDRIGLRKFYQSLDLFLIPSFQEGLAIVGIEAMACGVPVISTKCGGPESYIVDGENGFLVDFDTREMTQKVCKLIIDRQCREKFSISARVAIEERYGYEHFKESLNQEIEGTWSL